MITRAKISAVRANAFVFFLVIRNSSNKRRIGSAALIRGRHLLTFFPRCGASLRAVLIRVIRYSKSISLRSQCSLNWNANSKRLSQKAKNGLEIFHHLRSVLGNASESVIRHGRMPFYKLASLPPKLQGSKENPRNNTPHVPETKAANANDITIYYSSKSNVYSDYWDIWDKTWLHGEKYW